MCSQVRLPVRVSASEHPQACLAVHWRLLVLLVGGAAFLGANLYSWRLQPFLLSGDQVFFWTAAWRIMQGDRLYQDFLQFTPPGVDLVYLDLFRLFGPRIWVTNAVALGLGVLLSGLCYALSRRVMDRRQAFLAGWLFLTALYGRLLCVTHHWFSALAVLTATFILMRSLNTGRLIAAGALLGLASFFTQTRGVAAWVAVLAYLIWEARHHRWRAWMLHQKIGWLAAAFCASLAALSAYFIRSVGLALLWKLQVTYVARYVTRSSRGSAFDLGLPHPMTLQHLPALAQYLAVYILAPLVCAIVLLTRALPPRRPVGASAATRDPVLLLAMVASALLAEVSMDISWLRLYCAAMPCIVLLVRLAEDMTAAGSGRFAQIAQIAQGCGGVADRAPLVLWAVVVILGLQQTWGRQMTQDQLLHLPGGTAVMSADAAERYDWIAQHTRPGQLFLQATWPSPYLPLALRAPVYVDVFSDTRSTRPEWVELSVRQLEQKAVRYIIVGSTILEPRDRRPGEYNLAAFIGFLNSRYRLIRTFPNKDQVWELRSADAADLSASMGTAAVGATLLEP